MSKRRHFRSLTTISLVCTTLAALAYSFLGPVQVRDLDLRDSVVRNGRLAPRHADLAYLAIDQESMLLDLSPELIAAIPAFQLMKEEWPWSRKIYPLILEQLFSEGARVVALDILFLTESPDDDGFRAALERYGDRVVLGANVADSVRQHFGTPSLAKPAKSLIASDTAFDPRVGFVNLWPDFDGVVRSAQFRLTFEQLAGAPVDSEARPFFSLTARMLQRLGMGDRIPDTHEPVPFRYAGFPGAGFPKRPIYELFLPQELRGPDLPPGFFKDKIVLIGPHGNLFHDEHRTPVDRNSPMPGPEIHLNILNAALTGEFVTEPSFALNIAHIVLAGFGAWLLGFLIERPVLRFVCLIGLVCAGYLGSLLAYNNLGLYLLVFSPALALVSSSMVFLVWEQVLERIERARTRRTLERYVSKNLVKELLDNPTTYFGTLGGVRRPVAVLFTDLRGFTTLTESADSEALVAQLNEYFSEMVGHIFRHDGTLDKFMGDAIMAVWGNIQSAGPADDVTHAVEAALAMRESLATLNARWRERGTSELGMGIGVNHGEAIVGNMGSEEKMELTVIGDTVNLGSRLEGLTKEYGLDFLIGEEAARHVGDRFHLQLVDSVRVKGKTRPVDVFTVRGRKSEPLSDAMAGYLDAFAKGVALYRDGRFDEAVEHFAAAARHRPDDHLADLYRQRCGDLLANPPGEKWDGVFVMTRK